jgi:arylesterase/paraoxonase
MRLKVSTVQYFDGNAFSTALENIGGANGINVSADGRSLYLSAASELTVHVYDRDPATSALQQRAAVAVPGFADNIDVLANGDLLLGVHTKIFDLLAHVGDAAKRSPSHILHLKAEGQSFRPETIYYNDGAEISGASVAAAVGKRLLIAPIFESKVLDCTWATAP